MATASNRLRLSRLEPRDVPSTVVEAEPNNTAAAANDVPVAVSDVLTAPASDWLTVQGVIGTNSDRDFFRIVLAGPAGLFVDVDSRDTNLSPTLDAVVDVYDASGLTLLGSNDEGYDFDAWAAPVVPAPAATSADPSLYLDLPAGTFFVRVSSFQSASTGAYELRMLADTGSANSVPVLDSRPGAPVSLHLDFDGHTATDDWGGYAAAAFDLTGGPATVTPGERLAIHNLWRVVAEDFAPFGVNVTTAEPASFENGVAYRVVVTNSPGPLVGQPPAARGAAIGGSFAGPGSNTGFVFAPGFTDYQGGLSGRIVAGALEMANESSRQFGVALGLRNYGGVHGQPGGIMQAPDAGLGRATWSMGLTHSGEFPVVAQDDTAVITSAANGITLAPDDAGDTVATAVPMVANVATGVIAHRGLDRDVFSFPGVQGNVTARVTVDRYAGNLNAAVRLLNEVGQVLGDADPDGTFDAALTVYLPAGATYFVEVRSHGGGGELGSYRVDVAAAPVTGPGQVLSAVVNDGATQRSVVTDVVVRFSRPMTFPNGVNAALQLATPAGPAAVDIDLSPSTPSQTVAVLRPPGGGSFPDGAYTLTIPAAEALDDTGNPLDGDSNGQPGGTYTFNFHRLFGDNDGDRDVDATDFAAFRQAFGVTTNLALDFDGDGDVDAADFAAFRVRFGTSV
jgi:hypothetical protein